MKTQIDEATIVVGLPKHGKSTVLLRETKEWLEMYPTGIVLAHDVNEELVQAGFSVAYDNIAQWRVAYKAAQAKREPFPRASSFVDCSNEEVGALVIELGKRHNHALDVRVPIKYALDEASESETSEPTYQGKQDRRIWSRRRHLGVAPYLNAQVVSDVNIKFWKAVTKVYIFAQSTKGARDLEEKLSLPAGALAGLVNAQKYRYLLWLQGEGLIDPTNARTA